MLFNDLLNKSIFLHKLVLDELLLEFELAEEFLLLHYLSEVLVAGPFPKLHTIRVLGDKRTG